MHSEPLDVIPIWLIFPLACLLTWLAEEGGYQLGKWRRASTAEEKEGPVGAMVASVLGLVAFMLAFTFGLAASRYDARRDVVLDEANAIGTAYLRAKLLPEPQRSNVEKLLREYVDTRVVDYRQARDADTLAKGIVRSEELQEKLWAQAVAASEQKPNPITGLFVQALNEVIDLHAKRLMLGMRSRIPLTIWVGLYGIAILGMASTGYQAGLAGTRRPLAVVGLVLAFAGVLYLVADLDRPGEGLVTTSQAALIDLQKSMKTAQ